MSDFGRRWLFSPDHRLTVCATRHDGPDQPAPAPLRIPASRVTRASDPGLDRFLDCYGIRTHACIPWIAGKVLADSDTQVRHGDVTQRVKGIALGGDKGAPLTATMACGVCPEFRHNIPDHSAKWWWEIISSNELKQFLGEFLELGRRPEPS